jgi:hypothetical protein
VTHQKVAQDPTRTPRESIRPSLDATLMLVKDKDGSTLNHASLTVDQPPGHTGNHARPGGLEYQERIECRLYVSLERWIGHWL